MSTFFDESVRVETLIHVPGSIIDDSSFPEAFKDFCESFPEREDAPLYKQLPLLARYADGENWPEASDVAEVLVMARVKGFLVQAATPVRSHYSGGPGYTTSWGRYHTEWLYAPTAAAIERVCVAWAKQTGAEDRARSQKAA